tara:strand:- start:83501 stop:85144 length:1644 start_codon:yes stop_codon:yes gene_type:complete
MLDQDTIDAIFNQVDDNLIRDSLISCLRSGDNDIIIQQVGAALQAPQARKFLSEIILELKVFVIGNIIYEKLNRHTMIELQSFVPECVSIAYKAYMYSIALQNDGFLGECNSDDIAYMENIVADFEPVKDSAKGYHSEYFRFANIERQGGVLGRATGNQQQNARRVTRSTFKSVQHDELENNTRGSRINTNPRASQQVEVEKPKTKELGYVMNSTGRFDFELGGDTTLHFDDLGTTNIDKLSFSEKMTAAKAEMLSEISDENLALEYQYPVQVGLIVAPTVDHAIVSARAVIREKHEEIMVNHNVIDIRAKILTPLATFASADDKSKTYSETPELLAYKNEKKDLTKLLELVESLRLSIDINVAAIGGRINRAATNLANDFIFYDLGFNKGQYKVKTAAGIVDTVMRINSEFNHIDGVTDSIINFTEQLITKLQHSHHEDLRQLDFWGTSEILATSLDSVYSVEECAIVEIPSFIHEMKICLADHKSVLRKDKLERQGFYNIVNAAHDRNEVDVVYLSFLDGTQLKSTKMHYETGTGTRYLIQVASD